MKDKKHGDAFSLATNDTYFIACSVVFTNCSCFGVRLLNLDAGFALYLHALTESGSGISCHIGLANGNSHSGILTHPKLCVPLNLHATRATGTDNVLSSYRECRRQQAHHYD
jgi:hypothetical protein